MTIGSLEEDRLRLDQLLGKRSSDGYLIRSPSTVTPRLDDRSGALRWQILAPELHTVWNSAIPFSLNDGSMWAGKGGNARIMAGIRAAYGPVVLTLAPQVSVHQNPDFLTVPYPLADRSAFAYPWHRGPESLDLPLRFGDEPFTTLDLGQSSLSVDAGPVAIGAATENLWWGPGIRSAIAMSNNAPGIPHAFLRTSKPVRTAIGELEGRWIVGSLQESRYFDFDPGNDSRSISALAATLRLRFDPDLTLGFARAVYAPADSRIPLAAAFDVLRSAGGPNTASATDTTRRPGPDQVFSLFGRWIFPESGFEAYAEWARFEQPSSLRDLLASPNHSQGYTLGLQWAKPLASSSAIRLQTEVTYLEPSSTFRERGLVSSYTSRRVLQGYTHGGQVIGASIGPGASSQWIATDYLRPSWQVGLFGGRVRWDNAAFYTSAPFRHPRAHDVSLLAGARGGYRFGRVDVSAELTTAKRYNYLFQSPSGSFADDSRYALDVRNQTLTLMVSPVGTLR